MWSGRIEEEDELETSKTREADGKTSGLLSLDGFVGIAKDAPEEVVAP